MSYVFVIGLRIDYSTTDSFKNNLVYDSFCVIVERIHQTDSFTINCSTIPIVARRAKRANEVSELSDI
jgi:hypothetical protein